MIQGTRRQVPSPQKGVKLQENQIRSLQKKWKKSASKSLQFSEPEFQSSEPAATSSPSIGSPHHPLEVRVMTNAWTGEGAPTLVGKNCQIQLVRTDPEPSLIFGIGTGTRTLYYFIKEPCTRNWVPGSI